MNIFKFNNGDIMNMDVFLFACCKYDSECDLFTIRIECKDSEFYTSSFDSESERDNQYESLCEFIRQL